MENALWLAYCLRICQHASTLQRRHNLAQAYCTAAGLHLRDSHHLACCMCRHQVLGGVKLVVGCPVVSSAGNMRFWLYLCQAARLKGADITIQGFAAAAQAGQEASTAYCHHYNTELMRKVRRQDLCCSLQVVSQLHLLAQCDYIFAAGA